MRLAQWFDFDNYFRYGSSLGTRIPAFVKYYGDPNAGLNNSIVPNGRQHVKPFMIGEMYLILAEASCRQTTPPPRPGA